MSGHRIGGRPARADTRKPAPCCDGLTVNGERDILGLWLGDGRRLLAAGVAKLKNRGVQDLWELTTVQACIIHLVRNTTSNAIESLNARYRPAVRVRGHFPKGAGRAEVSLPDY